jgi:Xaa-Pro aminopeptidase
VEEIMSENQNSMKIQERKPYFQQDFSAEEFYTRRGRVLSQIGDGVALLRGEGATGAFDIFRQNNDFYYLCGVEVPVSYLLIDGVNKQSTLYLPKRDAKLEESEGAQLSDEDQDLARRWCGVENVKVLEELHKDLALAKRIYIPQAAPEGRQACRDTLNYGRKINATDPMRQPTPEKWLHEQVRIANAGAELHDLSPIVDRLRTVKSAAELKMMSRTGRLSALAAIEAMRSSRAGVYEFQLGAAAEYIFLLNGARGGGYRPIIAAGQENIWNIHYYRNDSVLQDGDLVLFDYAPDCGNYTSDIGRMWPVNGKYSPLQRELYGFVVEYHKILLRHIRAGLTVEQVLESARKEAGPLVESWRWSKPIYKQAGERLLQFAGSLSHSVGMAVHDVGNYKMRPLEAGVVFALDPQMWVPEERLYIRVEDTVAVTENGVDVHTAAAPLELDEVEKMMRESGLIQFRAADH